MTPRTAQVVTYNGGAGKENEYALVVKDHGEGNLNLLVFDQNGAGTHRISVPRRDPSDYGPEGGGHTWH